MADTNTSTAPAPAASEARIVTGIVTRDKMDKTRRIEIQRLVRHPKYGKFVKRRTVCYAHDEANASHLGDTVEIRESRPLSKLKRWTLIRVVTLAPTRTFANLEGKVVGGELPPEATGTKPSA